MGGVIMTRFSIACIDMTKGSPNLISNALNDTLAQIRQFRGKVLYAHGRRPQFRDSSGRYRDRQELDHHSMHLLLREDKSCTLVGCIRFALCEEIDCGQVEAIFSAQRTAAFINRLGLRRSDILEGGRLIISPLYQGKGFGALLLQAGTVLGKKLNRRLI